MAIGLRECCPLLTRSPKHCWQSDKCFGYLVSLPHNVKVKLYLWPKFCPPQILQSCLSQLLHELRWTGECNRVRKMVQLTAAKGTEGTVVWSRKEKRTMNYFPKSVKESQNYKTSHIMDFMAAIVLYWCIIGIDARESFYTRKKKAGE